MSVQSEPREISIAVFICIYVQQVSSPIGGNNLKVCFMVQILHMSQLSLLEMHSGGEVASDLMSSCLTGHL